MVGSLRERAHEELGQRGVPAGLGLAPDSLAAGGTVCLPLVNLINMRPIFTSRSLTKNGFSPRMPSEHIALLCMKDSTPLWARGWPSFLRRM